MYSLVLVVNGEPVAVEDDAVLTSENLESVRAGSGAAAANGDCRGVLSISFDVGTKTGNITEWRSRSSCVMFVGLMAVLGSMWG